MGISKEKQPTIASRTNYDNRSTPYCKTTPVYFKKPTLV